MTKELKIVRFYEIVSFSVSVAVVGIYMIAVA